MPSPTATPADLYLTAEDVLVHPGPDVYAGDLVSFEVLAHDGADVGLQQLEVAVYHGDMETGRQLAFARVGVAGVGRRQQATLPWVWDTTGLSGLQTITVALDPDNEYLIGDEDPNNNMVTLEVDVLPAEARPLSEAGVRWVATESPCCVFNYMTNTAAARDIELIIATAEEAVTYVEELLQVTSQEKIVFDFVNRIVGHGGFAADSITISYVDRNYVGGNLASTMRHEVSHVLDRQLSEHRPVFITEGLAVYVAGGHFKPEPISLRMAAADAAGMSLPIAELADDFYPQQHELSYLQAASFVEYLLTTYGWDEFKLFVGAIQPATADSAALRTAAQLILSRNLNELEADWLRSLRARAVDPELLADVKTTISLYDTARRYQAALDPSAHFLFAWIPSIRQAQENQIVADYTRHPTNPENIALELMLAAAVADLTAGEYIQAQAWTSAVNAVLDAGIDFGVDPLAVQTFDLTTATLASGLEPQRLVLNADRATVTAIADWPELVELEYQLTVAGWQLSQ